MFDFLISKGASVGLATLMVELASAVQGISQVIVQTDTGKAGTLNAYGEEQATLDLRADEIIQDHMRSCSFVRAYASEESELQVYGEDGEGTGRIYTVLSDPLDGSSLIDVNFAVGTIVGVYEGVDIIGRMAREQVAAMVAVYGPRTTIMLTIGSGVYEFMLVPVGDASNKWEWQLSSEKIEMKGDKKYFAPGNLRACKERDDYYALVRSYIERQYTLRYSGGMVPDINHILKKGSGIFMYPGMPGAEQGKLRLLYECGPMAMIMEQAGGAASDGRQPILDLAIEGWVQRCPIFIGQKDQVEEAVAGLR